MLFIQPFKWDILNGIMTKTCYKGIKDNKLRLLLWFTLMTREGQFGKLSYIINETLFLKMVFVMKFYLLLQPKKMKFRFKSWNRLKNRKFVCKTKISFEKLKFCLQIKKHKKNRNFDSCASDFNDELIEFNWLETKLRYHLQYGVIVIFVRIKLYFICTLSPVN